MDDNNFINNGINDSTVIPESIWKTKFPNISDIKILMWTDDMIKTESKLVYNCDQFDLTQWLKDNQCNLLLWTDDLSKINTNMLYNVEPYRIIDKLNDQFEIRMMKEK